MVELSLLSVGMGAERMALDKSCVVEDKEGAGSIFVAVWGGVLCGGQFGAGAVSGRVGVGPRMVGDEVECTSE
jgi:hypothetical protein